MEGTLIGAPWWLEAGVVTAVAFAVFMAFLYLRYWVPSKAMPALQEDLRSLPWQEHSSRRRVWAARLAAYPAAFTAALIALIFAVGLSMGAATTWREELGWVLVWALSPLWVYVSTYFLLGAYAFISTGSITDAARSA